MIELYKNKADCCACGACASICPKNAISLESDEYGFAYPVINNDLCIQCSQCIKVCAFQNRDRENTPFDAYAAAVNDSEKIMHSTSGGLFAVLAEEVLRQNGIVFGAAIEKVNGLFCVHHIAVETAEELPKILKSKYVQSATEDCYKTAKKHLDSGRFVLYSGTPCQIAGLKGYLKKNYDNLLTVDIVCHGVPSIDLFRKYISEIEKREGFEITDFQFRDKETGWGHFNKIEYRDINNKLNSASFDSSSLNYSYMDLFLQMNSLRENCYTCKYTGPNRPADITLGDFWGIKEAHSECLIENGGALDSKKGISCVVINTDKGLEFFDKIKPYILYYKSSFLQVSKGNEKLRHPARLSPQRKEVLDNIKNNGYASIEKDYQKHLNKQKIKQNIKKLVPKKLWSILKQL